MKTRIDITVKIDLITHKKLRELKKKTGASIKWLIDTSVNEYSKK
jgi:hypothetical protein